MSTRTAEERRAYNRAWKAAHPEQVRACRMAYREKSNANTRAWRAANPDRKRAQDRAYCAAHPEQRRAYSRAWDAAHREERRAALRAYKAAHPERVHLHSARRRAKRFSVPCVLTLETERALLAPMRCSVTGLELVRGKGKHGPLSPSLDRIAPALGYVPGNVRLVCQRFNVLRKDAHVSRDAEFRDRVLAELGDAR